MKQKAQAALEFLTTYGWALLMLIIAVAAMYFLGVFNIEDQQPTFCLATNGNIECVDAFIGEFNTVGPENTLLVLLQAKQPVTLGYSDANPLDITFDDHCTPAGDFTYQILREVSHVPAGEVQWEHFSLDTGIHSEVRTGAVTPITESQIKLDNGEIFLFMIRCDETSIEFAEGESLSFSIQFPSRKEKRSFSDMTSISILAKKNTEIATGDFQNIIIGDYEFEYNQ